MSSRADALFTARFFTMCAFSFTVFLSAFQLLPTAPFRILDLGGTKVAAGLFLGFLTYASAFSAPLTGALADRLGRRRTMVVCSLAIAALAAVYASVPRVELLLAVAVVHGVFWSGLLSASAAYITDFIPPGRRAEGIGYWGLSTVLAIAIAPTLGLWIHSRGWLWVCGSVWLLNLTMTAIALRLKEQPSAPTPTGGRLVVREMLEWRVLIVAFTMFLYAFGYGGIISFVALYADANGVTPRGLYFSVFALAIVFTRPFAGRLADRVGHTAVFLPCIVLIVIGYALLAIGGTTGWLVASAIVFGAGFGSAYPVFAAHIISHVPVARRGAAFGGILAALDTGIGTGSIATGWMIQHVGFSGAYTLAAIVAACALPYFLATEPRFLVRERV
jgi:MFS family permease